MCRPPLASLCPGLLLAVFLSGPLRAAPLITEFQADNAGTLTDGAGGHPDWIEIHNPDAAPADLAGWRLTDDPARLIAWTFSAVSIPPGGYLVVAADDKPPGFTDPTGLIHCSLRLDAGGEYLALLRPDGTVAQEFAPYPLQAEDGSYGLAVETRTAITGDSDARLLVPGSPVPDTWRTPFFSDAAWTAGKAAAGFNLENGPVIGAQELITAYQIPAGTAGNQDYGGSLGMDFRVVQPVTVAELGVFDDRSNGLSTTITAQLWRRNDNGTPAIFTDDTGQTALATLSFTPAAPGTLAEGSRFKPLAAPLTLAPGAYTIVAWGYNLSEQNGNGQGNQNVGEDGGRIQYVGTSRYGSAGQFPATADSGPEDRYAAGTFRFIPGSDPLRRTDVQGIMHGVNSSLLSRVRFEWDGAAGFDFADLTIGYDDGFSAWLNGTLIASRNAPATLLYNSASTAPGNALETIRAAIPPGTLTTGTNVLAFHGLNAAASDRDFACYPALDLLRSGNQTLRYFTRPTPGAANDPQSTVDGYVADTSFSVKRGLFDTPFQVTITCTTPGAEIRYTTDASTPSATHGAVYAGPVNVTTTTTLRAIAVKPGWVPSNVDTQSYLFPADAAVMRTTIPAGYPSTWNGVVPDYAMEDNAAQYARCAGNAAYTPTEARAAVAASLRALPSLSLVTDAPNLFDQSTGIYMNPSGRGDAWERPCSAELIHPDGKPGFQIDGGIQVQGLTSRNLSSTPKLNLRIVFKNRYGPGKLDYQVFPGIPLREFNTIRLRSNYRDSWLHTNGHYIADQFIRETERDMGQPGTTGDFWHIYINGMYWGVYNACERPDAEMAASHLGGTEDDWDVVTLCCGNNVVDGDTTEWNALLTKARAGFGTLASYQAIQGLNADGSRNSALPRYLDADNFADYFVNGYYHATGDWPGNFYVQHRDTPDQGIPFYFVQWDNDLAFAGANPNLDKVTMQPGNLWWVTSPGEIEIPLRANPEYRLKLADRAYRHLFNNGALSTAQSRARWDRIASKVQPAMYAESARWGDRLGTLYTVQDHLVPLWNAMRNTFFPQRPGVIVNQLRSQNVYPAVNPPEFNQNGGTVAPGFNLRFLSPSVPVYYTTDGTDPRLPGGAVSPSAFQASVSGSTTLRLIDSTGPGTLRAFTPQNESLGTAWRGRLFDDSAWIQTTAGTGAGFDLAADYLPHIDLDLRTGISPPMFDTSASCYLRYPFQITDPASIQTLTLRLKYDDGFTAWINGVKVGAAFDPAELTWDAAATGSRTDTAVLAAFSEFNAATAIPGLVAGTNILAIQGLNSDKGGSDFLILPELIATGSSGGTAVPIASTRTIKARALNGTVWSPLHEEQFIVGTPAAAGLLRVTEIHYHPADPSAAEIAAGFTSAGDFEFIELTNTAAQTLDLTGAAFTAGLDFSFDSAADKLIAPGQSRVIAANRAAFSARHGMAAVAVVAGTFASNRRLANSGESVTLGGFSGSVILSFAYDDEFPWPVSPDGTGPSLVLRDDLAAPDMSNGAHWRASLGEPTPGVAVGFRSEWMNLHFTAAETGIPAVSGDSSDPDHDGVNNLVERATGMNPRKADSLPFSIERAADGWRLSWIEPLGTIPAISPQWSDGTNGWQDARPLLSADFPDQPSGAAWKRVSRLLPDEAGRTRIFVRLLISE